MLKVAVGKDGITLKLEGTKKFLALKSKIVIPRQPCKGLNRATKTNMASKDANWYAYTWSIYGWNHLAEGW